MAGLIDPNDIAKARQSGYSDNEISAFLAEKHPEKFKAARDAGYNDQEIISHLSGDDNKPSGIGAGVMQGVSNLASGTASTLGLAGVKSDALNSIAEHAKPKDYKAAPIIREGGHWYNPADYSPGNIPQALAEQFPGLAQDLTAGAAGARIGKTVGGLRGAVVGGIGSGLASTALRTFGPGAHENAKARTGDENAEVNGSDIAREAGKQLIQAPINAVGLNRLIPGLGSKVAGVGLEGAGNALKKYLATVGTEAAVGGGREAVNQAATNAGQEHGAPFDPNRAAEAAITSGAGGALLVAPKLAGNVASASKFRKFGGDNAEAATALANRQLEAADGRNLVGALGGTKVASEAVANAHAAVNKELREAADGSVLSQDNSNTLQRIKDGGKVSDSALTSLASEASPEVMHLARQALLSSKLKGMGDFGDGKFTGGLSGLMEQKLRPIYNPVATGASALAAASGLGPISGMIGMSAPHVLGAVYGSYAAARLLDKLTGARSPAKGFTDKFGDPNAPIRTPAAPTPDDPYNPSAGPWGARVSDGPTGPTVAPPQAPEPSQPSLRATLNSNAKVEEGMARIAKQIQADKQKSMVDEALPALQQLAASRPAPEPAPAAPEAPALSPIALKMLGVKLKTGLPEEAPAPAAPAPEAPAPTPAAFDALKPLMGRQRAIMRGLAASSKQQIADNVAQRKAAGVAQAEGIAADSPLINEQGGLDALSNTAFTKRGSELISAANVMKKLTAQPAEEAATPTGPASPAIGALMQKLNGQSAPSAAANPAAPPPAMAGNSSPKTMADILAGLNGQPAAPPIPQAPMIAKISKKLNGKVEQTPHPEADQPYMPIPEEGLYRKMMTDEEMVNHEFEKYTPEKKKAYGKKSTSNRESNRNDTLGATEDHSAADRAVANALYHQLDHQHTRAAARKAVNHYTAQMSPEAAAAVNAKFTDEVIAHRWKN